MLLLRPHAVPETDATGETGLWPMFVMVVTEPTDRAARLALPLFELLDRPKQANELSIVAVESAWSVLDPANALLTLTVRAALPVSFDLRILLPAAPVLRHPRRGRPRRHDRYHDKGPRGPAPRPGGRSRRVA